MNIKINNKINILPSAKPLIVAEISGNHNGSKKSFLKHIVSAAKNGADLVKIQTYEPDDIVIKNLSKKFLIKNGIWRNKNLWEIYNKAHTPFKWHKDAFRVARKHRIRIFQYF